MKIRKREKSPLFLRYLLSYALVVLLLFAGVTIYLSAQTQKQVQDAMVNAQINRLTRIAIRHEDYISAMLSTAEEIGLSPHIESFDYAKEPWKAYELQLQLIPYTSTNTFCDQMYLHFTGDERMYSSASSMTVKMFAELMHFEKAKPGELKDLIMGADRLSVLPAQAVESSLVDGAAPRMVTFLMPLGANPGTTKGTLLYMVKESVYGSLFADAIEREMNTYIFYNGNVLACSEDLPVSLTVQDAELEEGNSHTTLKRDGKDYLLVTTGNRSWGMRYATVLRMEDVTSAAWANMTQQLVILLGMTLLCMGLAVWMSRRHTRPIQDLSGLFEDREGTPESDEIQRISSGIRQLTEHNSELISRLDSARPMQRHDFVFRFVKGRFATRLEAAAAAGAVGLDIDRAWYQIILCSMPEGTDRPLEMNRPPFDRFPGITGVGVELMALKGMLYLVFADRAEEMPEYAELIRLNANGDAGPCVTAASALHQSFEEAPAAYLEAAAAWDNRFLMGDKKVLRYEDISSDIADILPRAQKLTASISQALALGNRDLLEDRISDMLYFMKNNSMSPFAFRILYNDVISTLTRGRAEALSADSQDMYDIFSLSSCQTIDDLDAMLRRLCDALLAEAPRTEAREEDVIDQAARYMEEHFDDPEISMAAIAESFDLSTTRLSMSFREKKGMTPLDYLTLLRCEKAKDLLENTEMTIREISARTGYYDSGSFIRRFKQVTGMTPLQYRRSRTENQEVNGEKP